jgi:general secretion pathway protein A
MYAQFFGLKQEPFSIAPDPRYLFMSERHREALAHLLYGLNGGGGFVLLSGEIGAGKTTVCRCFLEKIPKRCNVAYIFNPKLTVIELLKAACEEFGIVIPELSGPVTVSDYLGPINDFLLRTHAVGQNNVLIIDEAQNLSTDVLEQLRLLTNLETSERKLLQIILIGQPELRDLLARPELEQLAQRVIARFHLEALSEEETSRYIRHRLVVAGLKKALPFDRRARRRIHELTRGIPRRINLLCDRAMLGAYASGQARVDRRMVDQAAREVFYKTKSARTPFDPLTQWMHTHPWAVGTLGLGLALLVAAAVMAGMRQAAPPASPKAVAGAGGSPKPEQVKGLPGTLPPASAPASVPVPVPAPLPLPAPASAPVAAAASNNTPPAPAASQAVAATFLTRDFSSRFANVLRNENDAWHELAPLWGLPALDAGKDPCQAAAQTQTLCYRGNTTLALVRQLDRPVILSLKDESERPVFALLVGLGPNQAMLRMAGETHTVSLVSLATLWRGEYATYWRAPAGYSARLTEGQSGLMVDQLATQLAAFLGEPPPAQKAVFNAVMRARLSTFQMAHGLKPDGIAGPTTFMQLNRVSGVDEPRLLRPTAPNPAP